MHHSWRARIVALSSLVAIGAGCDPPIGDPPQRVATSTPPAPPPPLRPPPVAGSVSEPPAAEAGQPPAPEPTPPAGSPAATTSAEPPLQTPQAMQPPIRLSAGVAVPQSLPGGTQIGV